MNLEYHQKDIMYMIVILYVALTHALN